MEAYTANLGQRKTRAAHDRALACLLSLLPARSLLAACFRAIITDTVFMG